LIAFKDTGQLEAWLAQRGIDTRGWGTGNAKRVDDLWAEIAGGDCVLKEASPYRLVSVVQLIVRRGDAYLVEAEQELVSGQRRSRNRPPSEKLKSTEGYAAGALRCLWEELGLEAERVTLLEESHTVTEEIAESTSYPGLLTQYAFHTIAAKVEGLPASDFWLDNHSFHGLGDPVRRHRWAWRPIGHSAAGLPKQGPG
jgi:hypothetical protein